MRKLRLFIAVTPPKEFLGKLARLQEKLKTENFPVRWEDPENLHLTLVFLGHITQAQMEAASRAAKATAQKFSPFVAQAGGLGYFYKKRGDSIVFVDTQDPQKRFRQIFRELFQNLVQASFFPQTRFSAHITIGRLREKLTPAAKKQILGRIADIEIPPLGQFTVSGIDIYESIFQQRDKKRRYHLLKRYEFPVV